MNKLTLGDLMSQNIFDPQTHFIIGTFEDDITFQPGDCFVIPAFEDCVIDRVIPEGKNVIKILFETTVLRRAQK